MNEYITPKLYADLGLLQSSAPFSIFYLFHNANLLNKYGKKRVVAQKYNDNITPISMNKLVKCNTQKLTQVHNQVYKSQRAKHGSEFCFPKYHFIYISRKQNINYIANIKLHASHLIQEISIAINLGVIFESKFSQKNQIPKIKEKITKSIMTPINITRSIQARSYFALQKLFKVVIISHITHEA